MLPLSLSEKNITFLYASYCTLFFIASNFSEFEGKSCCRIPWNIQNRQLNIGHLKYPTQRNTRPSCMFCKYWTRTLASTGVLETLNQPILRHIFFPDFSSVLQFSQTCFCTVPCLVVMIKSTLFGSKIIICDFAWLHRWHQTYYHSENTNCHFTEVFKCPLHSVHFTPV